jgi:hypothetical protein
LPTDRRLFLAAGPAAVFFGSAIATGAIAGKIATDEHLDAALISLGKQFEEAWQHEIAGFAILPDGHSDKEADALTAPCSELADKIMNIHAKTIEGLQVKARAILWCHSGEFDGFGGTTDELLAAGIVRDLLAI